MRFFNDDDEEEGSDEGVSVFDADFGLSPGESGGMGVDMAFSLNPSESGVDMRGSEEEKKGKELAKKDVGGVREVAEEMMREHGVEWWEAREKAIHEFADKRMARNQLESERGVIAYEGALEKVLSEE